MSYGTTAKPLLTRASLALLLALCACGAPAQTEDALDTASSPLTEAVPVYFNHSYGMFSAATVTALHNSAWVKEQFVDVEVRTTTRPDLSYTGTYLNMRQTYLELFPEGTFGYPIGVTGIALGDEVTGGLNKVVDAWKAEFGDTEASSTLISRTVNGVTTPWFWEGDLKWALWSDYTGLWLMEYVPNAGSTTPRTRLEDRATRYAPGKLARNVQAAIYGVPDADRAKLRRSLVAAGLTVVGSADRFAALTALDDGTRRVIYVQPAAPGRIGLLGAVIKLNRVQPHTEQLGNGLLEVSPRGLPFAFLWFVQPNAVESAIATSLAR